MKRRTRPRALTALLALALALCVCAGASAEKVSNVGFYFDTVVTLTLYDPEPGLMEELFAACDRYEKLLSKTVEGSDVDRVNHAGGQPVKVDPETWEILRRAGEISEASGRAFSVTIAPVTALWDFTGDPPRKPTPEEIAEKLPLVDDSRLVLGEDGTVTLPEGMEIDLGGIAKGYIADQVAALCEGRVTGAVLNFGGNVYCVGRKPDGSGFNVGIRDPQGSEFSTKAVVTVTDTSVVTSGIYERYFIRDGVWYHHILDPETGVSADSDLASATVVHPSSMTADAVATACIVLGRDGALELLDRLGLDGMVITREGDIAWTEGFDTATQFRLYP